MQNRLRKVAGAAQEIERIALQARRIAFQASQDVGRQPLAGSSGLHLLSGALQDLAAKVQQASQAIVQDAETLSAEIDGVGATLADLWERLELAGRTMDAALPRRSEK